MTADLTPRPDDVRDSQTDLGETGHALRKARAASKKTIIGFPTFAVHANGPEDRSPGDDIGTLELTKLRPVPSTESPTAPQAARPHLQSVQATTSQAKRSLSRRSSAPLWLGIAVTGLALGAVGLALRASLFSNADPSTSNPARPQIGQRVEGASPAPKPSPHLSPAEPTKGAAPGSVLPEIAAPTAVSASAAALAPAPIAPELCSLQIVSSPPGAAVLVDDLPLGVTPVRAQGLACGVPARVVVVGAQFKPWQRTITPEPGAERVVRAPLIRPESVLHVTSQPSGATVLVGGKVAGVTPLLLEVPAFVRVHVSVRKPGFGSGDRTVVARTGRTNRVHALLLRMGERE